MSVFCRCGDKTIVDMEMQIMHVSKRYRGDCMCPAADLVRTVVVNVSARIKEKIFGMWISSHEYELTPIKSVKGKLGKK